MINVIFLPLIIGAVPFAIGSLLNWYMMTYTEIALPYTLIAIIFLLLWAAVAFVCNKNGNNTKKVIVFLNLFGFLDLLLIAIQILIFNAYWFNYVGILTQHFYLPILNIGFKLASWSNSVFTSYFLSFALLVLATYIGCKLKEKMVK